MKLNQNLKDSDKTKSEYIVDIKKLPDYQLLEIHERQSKIIKNKSLLQKLPDKGLKLIEKNQQILNEIEIRKRTTDEIITGISEMKLENQINENDNETNSLSSSCSSLSQEGISSSTITNQNVEKFAKNRSCKFDRIENSNRFIPSHSNKQQSQCSKKQYEEKDISAACIPNQKYDIKKVSLQQVVQLKGRETLYIKDLELREAQEKLINLEFNSNNHSIINNTLAFSSMNYREKNEDDDEENDADPHQNEEENELIDDDEDDRRGTITFTIQE